MSSTWASHGSVCPWHRPPAIHSQLRLAGTGQDRLRGRPVGYFLLRYGERRGPLDPSPPVHFREMAEKCGRGERIRTSGPCLPKTVLYQAELLPDGAPVVFVSSGADRRC